MRQILHRLLVAGCLLLPITAAAQWPVVFELDAVDQSIPAPPAWNEKADSLQVAALADNWQKAAWRKGFLQATYRISRPDSLWSVQLVPGLQFRWITLSGGNVPATIQSDIQFQAKYFTDAPLQPPQFAQLAATVVAYYEENGYPFVSVQLDSVQLDTTGGIRAALKVTSGPLITIDTFQITGPVTISAGYLARYLDVVPGEPYRESRIQAMRERLDNLPFLKTTKSPEVLFIREKALVRLYLEETNASAFNFLIGILPNSDQQGGGLLVNGEAFLRLENPFGRGRQIAIDWKNLQPRSPQLKANLAWPYLFDSPVGVDASFHLFKRDTFWVDIEGTLGLRYALQGNDHLRIFLKNKSSNLITVDTQQVRLSQSLPDRLDLRYNWLGLALMKERVDYRFNPRAGYRLQVEASGGSRSIRANPAITGLQRDNFDYGTLYDSLQEAVLSGRLTVLAEKFWPVGKQATFLTAYEAGYMYAATLWTNELFRIGGNQLLRGFDEESILANHYHVATFEFRYLLGRNAYFNIFGDVAYVERRVAESPLWVNRPVGIGGGLAFETGAGIFEVNYALGRLNADNPFAWRKGRVHLGYVSYF